MATATSGPFLFFPFFSRAKFASFSGKGWRAGEWRERDGYPAFGGPRRPCEGRQAGAARRRGRGARARGRRRRRAGPGPGRAPQGPPHHVGQAALETPQGRRRRAAALRGPIRARSPRPWPLCHLLGPLWFCRTKNLRWLLPSQLLPEARGPQPQAAMRGPPHLEEEATPASSTWWEAVAQVERSPQCTPLDEAPPSSPHLQ